MSGPCLSDGRVRTDEVILAENEGRKVLPVGMHSADLARAPARVPPPPATPDGGALPAD